MTLTEKQIDYIANSLEFYGMASEDLRNDVLDHICTYIEEGDFSDFDDAYRQAVAKFGGQYAFGSLQRETFLMTGLKGILRLRIALYASAFAGIVPVLTGMLFKIMHWPFASILLCVGVMVIALVFLPLFFYTRYKEHHRKMVS